MLYILEKTDLLGAGFEKAAVPFLSRQRLEKISALRSPHDRTDGCAVYLLLRLGLFREYGISDAPEFIFGEHGKPYLKGSSICFNMSHAKNAVCCIVSSCENAVDITDIREVKNNVMRRVCDDDELRLIEASEDKNRTFLKMWTRKECLSKLSGKGMSESFRRLTDKIPESRQLRTIERDDYILSYWSQTEETINYIKEKELLDSMKALV